MEPSFSDKVREVQEHTRLIKGEMSPEEVETLWEQFLKDGERFERFLTLLNLYGMGNTE